MIQHRNPVPAVEISNKMRKKMANEKIKKGYSYTVDVGNPAMLLQ